MKHLKSALFTFTEVLKSGIFFLYSENNQTNKVIEKKNERNSVQLENLWDCVRIYVFFLALPLNIFSRVVFIDINKQSTVISI